jgi:hypothetical protein
VQKSQKILSGVIIATALVFAVVLLWQKSLSSNTTTTLSPATTTTPTASNPDEIPLIITPPVKVDTSNWKVFRNEEYGVTIKYPEDWQAENTFYYGTNSISLHKKDYVIIFTIIDYKEGDLSGGGRIVSDVSGYKTFLINNGKDTISRSTTEDFWEINGQPYIYVCHMQTNQNNLVSKNSALCDEFTKTKKAYLEIIYELSSGDKFDDNLLQEMDSILQNISFE